MLSNISKYFGYRRDEDKSLDYKKNALSLPWSVTNFQCKLKSLGYKEDETSKIVIPPTIQKILKYSGAALKVGRPLNKVVVVVAGDVGAGKSSCVNKLFHDDLCKTRFEAPKTRILTEYGKELYVTTEQPIVKGTLSFVDTPGLNNQNVNSDDIRVNSLFNYRVNSVDWENRQVLPEDHLVVREKVYPNVILLVVRATDHPYVSETSDLILQLRALADCQIVDLENINLIIVATHAMSLPCVEKKYKELCDVITRRIQRAVHEILSIMDVKVVFIENMPEDYNMKKGDSSNFYKLPDGQLSHQNLIQALNDLFKANEDNLGNLLCSWYFTDNCPDKATKPTKIMTSPVDLPCSLPDFNARREALGLKMWDIRKRSPEGQMVVKYSGTALETGRPLNKVMILMAGQSGAGKSTTINSLFNAEVCAVSSDKSITRTVTEYGVDLCVTAESPPVKGTLSFVDVPGSLDVDQSKEGVNLALISNFRQKHHDLVSRQGFTQKFLPISEDVYPNLVLFIVKAGDNRMVGPDSHLSKSLKTLRECRLLDRECTNLIVVVTHAGNLAIKEEVYVKKCNETKYKIREAVWNVLQIMDVKVVFVENNPEDYGMVKGEGTDFYRLPDGQLSHYNLIHAINDHFKKHGDNLGRLLCAWYFADSCPQKNKKPNELHSVQHDSVSIEETNEALHQLNVGMQATQQDEEAPSFRFQYLGRGYCPKTETLKNVNVYSGTDTKHVKILCKKYVVPKCVEIVEKNEKYYHQLSCKSRDKYEQSRHASYGLEADVKLVVNVDARGRWVQDKSAENIQSALTILDETRLANVRMDEPEKNIKRQLKLALEYLPTNYDDDTAFIFNEFFSKWGSHFICDEWIGGFFKVEHSVTASTYNEKYEQGFLKRVQCRIRGIDLPGNVNVDLGSNVSGSKEKDMQEETVIISGGDPPSLKSLDDLTPQMMSSWVDSIKSKPTELLYSIKLYPYYHLIEGEGKTALRQATVDYLGDIMSKKLKIRRDDLSNQYLDDVKSEECDKNCFPPSALVCTKNGLITMKDLKPNTEVLTVHYEKTLVALEPVFTEVLTYLHYDPHITSEFLVIYLENDQKLTVTRNHLIFFYEDKLVKEIRAKKLQIGDKLLVVSTSLEPDVKVTMESVKVVNIKRKKITGVYSPLTHNGTLIVDGVFVSCYANIDSHAIAHMSMLPLRWWHTMRRTIYSAADYKMTTEEMPSKNHNASLFSKVCQRDSPIHVYAKLMMMVRSNLPLALLQD